MALPVSSLGSLPTSVTRRKVKQASKASAVAGGVVTIATWLLAARFPVIFGAPSEVREAAELVVGGVVGGVVTGVSTWWAGYHSHPDLDETVNKG